MSEGRAAQSTVRTKFVDGSEPADEEAQRYQEEGVRDEGVDCKDANDDSIVSCGPERC